MEGGDNTDKGEEAEILVIHDSILAAAKQNLVKRKLLFIDTFNQEGSAFISAMRNLTVGVFEHLDITSVIDIYLRIKYI